ncbi:MAG TPA: hypothetical protein VME20_12605 [Acidimicrobiales bacterium]|nr:hypothetical protein [Acidimicrobiales bacterium]
MAELDRDGPDLVVRLSTLEKAEAAHGDVRVPMSTVRNIEIVDDAVHAVNAFTKTIGASWPGRFVIGTFRSDGKVFAVVHHSTPRGVKVTLEGANFDELLVGCNDPEATVRHLGAEGS